LKHLSAFTDNLQTFLELSDEAHMQAQVLTLDFGTSSVVAVMDDLRAEAIAETNMAKRELPSREDFPRQRSPWSYDEEQALRSALLLGFDVDWIGLRLNRTSKAVQRKIDRMRAEGMML
jgi:hypothetical protein